MDCVRYRWLYLGFLEIRIGYLTFKGVSVSEVLSKRALAV